MSISLGHLEQLFLSENSKYAKDRFAIEMMGILYIAARNGSIEFFDALEMTKRNYLLSRILINRFIDEVKQDEVSAFAQKNKVLSLTDTAIRNCVIQLRWRSFVNVA